MDKPRVWIGIRSWQRHSTVLLISGLVYIFMGVNSFRVELNEKELEQLAIALQIMPINLWALTFIFVGLLAIVSSLWPIFSNTWGYAVLTGYSSAWSAIYWLQAIVHPLPGRENISAGFVWALIAFMWWAISGLVNPDHFHDLLEEFRG